MFGYTFRMLSLQFCTSLIFTEKCFAFLLKVYTKQSRIWVTLATSKMELFVTIGICKVIFCRLVLHTQYCPMIVFISVSSLLVPFCSRWFHRQTPEMVLFVTITNANVLFYLTMVWHIQLLPVNFLFFVSVCYRVHFIPGGPRQFQVVPARFRWFRLVLGGSSSFLVLACTQFLVVIYK